MIQHLDQELNMFSDAYDDYVEMYGRHPGYTEIDVDLASLIEPMINVKYPGIQVRISQNLGIRFGS